VVYCHNVLEQELIDMASEDKNVILPDRQLIDEWSMDVDCMLIIDDLMSESVESKTVNYLFTIGSHHKRAICVILLLILYRQGKFRFSPVKCTPVKPIIFKARIYTV
jgi:hypothetical protein